MLICSLILCEIHLRGEQEVENNQFLLHSGDRDNAVRDVHTISFLFAVTSCLQNMWNDTLTRMGDLHNQW